jgi:hypothetical protein
MMSTNFKESTHHLEETGFTVIQTAYNERLIELTGVQDGYSNRTKLR